MDLKDQQEKLMLSYDEALKDTQNIIEYLEGKENPEELNVRESEVIKELADENSDKNKIYSDAKEILGGTIGIAYNNAVSSANLSYNYKADEGDRAALIPNILLGGGIAAGLLGVLLSLGGIAVGGPIGVAILAAAVPTVTSWIKYSKLRKYRNERKEEFKAAKENIEKAKEKLNNWLSNCSEQIKQNSKIYDDKINEIRKQASADIKEKAEQASIKLDDLVNLNTNKRIQQYNQIVLDQFQAQKQLEEEYYSIVTEYSRLKDENERLLQIIGNVTAYLNSLNLSTALIDDLLNKDMGD